MKDGINLRSMHEINVLIAGFDGAPTSIQSLFFFLINIVFFLIFFTIFNF